MFRLAVSHKQPNPEKVQNEVCILFDCLLNALIAEVVSREFCKHKRAANEKDRVLSDEDLCPKNKAFICNEGLLVSKPYLLGRCRGRTLCPPAEHKLLFSVDETPVTTTQQILDISPKDEVAFFGPYDSKTSVDITLSNPSERHVSYRVETNRPDFFRINANMGKIGPHDSASLTVLYKLAEKPDLHGTLCPKILVYSILLADPGLGQHCIWMNAQKDDILCQILNCLFIEDDQNALLYLSDGNKRLEKTLAQLKSTNKLYVGLLIILFLSSIYLLALFIF